MIVNELVFFAEVLLIVGCILGALKIGKEAVTTAVAVFALIANLFVLKQIKLFGLEVTASDAFAVGSLLGLNALQEFFGRDEAKRSIWITFYFMLFFALVSQLHLLFQPSESDWAHPSFLTLLSPSFRLLVASIGVFFIVQQIDIRFFSFLKNKLPSASFPLRSFLSLLVSQFFDTVLFSFAGLFGLVASVLDIIVVSLAIKCIAIACLTTGLKWAKI